MFEVRKNIIPPKVKRTRIDGNTKYPFTQMEPGDSFFVPQSEMVEGDDAKKFRTRIHKSAKNWALREHDGVGDRKTFTVVVMPTDDDEGQYKAGDVGVWLDKKEEK